MDAVGHAVNAAAHFTHFLVLAVAEEEV